ncbi:MAG: hypothetical protein V1809_11145 [Planctomycetota bacterium]
MTNTRVIWPVAFIIAIAIASFVFCSFRKRPEDFLLLPSGDVHFDVEIMPAYQKVGRSSLKDDEVIKASTLYLNEKRKDWHGHYFLKRIGFLSNEEEWVLVYQSRGQIDKKVRSDGFLEIVYGYGVDSFFTVFIDDKTLSVRSIPSP